MNLPFTSEQFFEVFRQYNYAVWPAPVVLTILAIGITFAKRWTFAGLAFFWLWSGVIYHVIYFAPVNPAARIFGALFVFQASLFAAAAIRGNLRFDRTALGLTVISYALFVYPLLGFLLGHRYPSMPTFGAPCPMTIFTFGILCMLRRPLPKSLLIIPVVWVVIGTTASFAMGMYEDLGLPFAALATLPRPRTAALPA